MKKKWIVIAPLLVLALAGIAVTMPIWAHLWQMYVPQPKVAIDRGTSREAIDGLVEHFTFAPRSHTDTDAFDKGDAAPARLFAPASLDPAEPRAARRGHRPSTSSIE